MKHYYIINPNFNSGLIEVTESEFYSIIGDEEHRDYASKVYKGIMSIDEVPEENRATVESIVAARINKFGEYNSQPISNEEFMNMIEEVL